MSDIVFLPAGACDACAAVGAFVYPSSPYHARRAADMLLEETVEEARERTPRHSLAEVDGRGIRGWWYLALAVLERRETWVPQFNLYLETATDWADGPGPPSFVEANRANEAQRLVLARDPYRWPGET